MPVELQKVEKDTLTSIFESLDKDNSGTLEKREILKGLRNQKIINAIQSSNSNRLLTLLKPSSFEEAFLSIKTETKGHVTLDEFKSFAKENVIEPIPRAQNDGPSAVQPMTASTTTTDIKEKEIEKEQAIEPEIEKVMETENVSEPIPQAQNDGPSAVQPMTASTTTTDIKEKEIEKEQAIEPEIEKVMETENVSEPIPQAQNDGPSAVQPMTASTTTTDIKEKEIEKEQAIEPEIENVMETETETEREREKGEGQGDEEDEDTLVIPVENTRERVTENDLWDRILDEDSGAYYYQHKETFETSWDVPVGYVLDETAISAPVSESIEQKEGQDNTTSNLWEKVLDEESGSYYYQHKETFETTWEVPNGYIE
eukprot:g1922.t1